MLRRSTVRLMAPLAVVAIAVAGCGGSSGPDSRTVRDCELTTDADCVGADLEGVDLRGERLPNADLRRANLQGADLRNANLRRADLRNADLTGARLGRANLAQARLEGASLVLARAQRANLSHPRARGLDLSGADLTGAKMGRSVLGQATLCGTTRPNGKIDNTDCDGDGPTDGSTTTTTLALAPFTVASFVGPSGYGCDTGVGLATFRWSVPDAGSVTFSVDGRDPSSSGGGLPAIVDNPDGESFGDVADGTVTFAFECNDQPHVIDVTWVQGSSPGVPIPGGPAVTRSSTLLRTS